jgi:transposase
MADEVGIAFEDVSALSDEAAYRLLFPGRNQPGAVYADPDWEYVHKELARVGVTLKLLHEEYASASIDGPVMGYGRFCREYRAFSRARQFVCHIDHRPAERIECDWDFSVLTGKVQSTYNTRPG